MRRVMRLLRICAVVCGLALLASTAQACPMCNQSIAGQYSLPHAYMYSILFMLAMPAVVFTGIGTAIYLKFRRFHAAAACPAAESPEPGDWPVEEASQIA